MLFIKTSRGIFQCTSIEPAATYNIEGQVAAQMAGEAEIEQLHHLPMKYPKIYGLKTLQPKRNHTTQ